MGLRGTEFVPAHPSSTAAASQRSRILILDFHLSAPHTTTTLSARRTLRDVATRFLHKLFFSPPPSSARFRLTALLVNPQLTPDTSPTLALLTETTALADPRSHPTALARLRSAARSGVPLPSANIESYTAALITEIARWSDGVDMSFVAAGSDVATALPDVLDATSLSGSASVTEVADSEAVQRVFDDLLARLHETRVALSLPACSAGAERDGVLRLVWRPRVLLEGRNAADALTATRLVRVATLPEDVLAGPPRVLWAEEEEDKGVFARICEVLRKKELGLLCVTRRQGGGGFVVLLVGRTGVVALVREVAHADALLPVPKEVDEVAESSDGDDGEAGLDLLPVGAYEPGSMRLGGTLGMVKARGRSGEMRGDWTGGEMTAKGGIDGMGGGAPVRRVNFSRM